MPSPILIAGIGNIFQGDDAFGVTVAHRLLSLPLPPGVEVLDSGIRSLDLAFALLDQRVLTILVDATARGGEPGTLYTIEIRPEDIPEESSPVNSHAIDAVCVLSMAKTMGVQFDKLFLIGCEPLILDCDDTGHIGLSDVVQAAVDRAVERVLQLINCFQQSQDFNFSDKEVLHECS